MKIGVYTAPGFFRQPGHAVAALGQVGQRTRAKVMATDTADRLDLFGQADVLILIPSEQSISDNTALYGNAPYHVQLVRPPGPQRFAFMMKNAIALPFANIEGLAIRAAQDVQVKMLPAFFQQELQPITVEQRLGIPTAMCFKSVESVHGVDNPAN